MQNKFIIIIFICLFSVCYTASGQKNINTPYSRFNLGSLQPQGPFSSLGMGGVGIATRNNSAIYYTNPASYSSLDTLSFVFDFGVDYGRNTISNGGSAYTSADLNFHHLVMGFPISKGWGFAVGIVPWSSGFYKISDEVVSTSPGYDPNIGTYETDHLGSGGITKLFLGSGIQISKNFSLGVNMTFLTGQLTRTNQFIFGDYTTVFSNKSDETLELNGLNFDYGLQYTASLKNNYFINIGASLTSGKNYRTKYNELTSKYSAYGASDTISYTADNNAKTFIPADLKFGISFGKKDKFTAELDYTTSKWSTSKIPGSTGYAADTKSFLFGVEYIPDKFSNYSFMKRIEYRIGAHMDDNYLIVNNEQLKEYGASFGVGIPVRRIAASMPSMINFYLDYTRRTGSLANSLHNEDYLTMGLSLNFYDNWFLKKKYN
jgi:hypothetical protein